MISAQKLIKTLKMSQARILGKYKIIQSLQKQAKICNVGTITTSQVMSIRKVLMQ